ncbi:MAG: hypothetical protein MJ245_07375 [Clostridia bacterium]|nr:hypothetical protein [Clostridia bacterium]
MAKKITMAKTNVNGTIYYITNCNVLENELQTTLKKIEMDSNVTISEYAAYTVINETNEFIKDLDKIIAKIIKGEKYSYYRGDHDKYYVTNYRVFKSMYDMLEAKASRGEK